MSAEGTKKLLRAFEKQAGTTHFLTSMSVSPPENYHNSETVEIDINRSGEEIAIPVADISSGYRLNEADQFVNKEFTPPIFKENFALNAYTLLKRLPGNTPFDSPQFQAAATARIASGTQKILKKIQRTLELQWSQIYTTGTVTLYDSDGNAVYVVDFKPKATHFPTAGTAWDAAGADPVGDLLALFNVIRNDGLNDVEQTVFSEAAFEQALKIDSFKDRYNRDGIMLGNMVPMQVGGTGGGNFRGTLEIGNYRINIWTYGGRYTDPVTGSKKQYIDGPYVCAMAPGRFDTTFGAIPRIVAPDSRVMKYVPRRVMMGNRRLDMSVNAWVTPDGETVYAGVGTRPMGIPTDIDAIGCLNTGL